MGHDPTRGSGQEVLKKSWVGSGQEVFEKIKGRVESNPTRLDPTRPYPRVFYPTRVQPRKSMMTMNRSIILVDSGMYIQDKRDIPHTTFCSMIV